LRPLKKGSEKPPDRGLRSEETDHVKRSKQRRS